MNNISLYKNPHIFSIPIDDYHQLVVNPLKSNCVRLLNTSQLNLLAKIEERNVIEYINRNKSNEYIDKFLTIAKDEGFISETNLFNPPQTFFQKSLSLWVHTTDSCNLRCKYCYIHTKDSNLQMSEDTIASLCEKIVMTVEKRNLEMVLLRLSGGEPFLNYKLWDKYFSELQNKLAIHNCSLKIAFLTNLTLINDNVIKFINKHNISISGSLDGIGQFNDKNRIYISQKGTYKTIHENIGKLVDAGINPFIMTVVSNENLDGLVELTDYIIQENLSIRFSIIQHCDFNYNKAYPIFTECYSKFEQAIKNGYVFTNRHKLCELHLLRFSDRSCSCGRGAGTIYANGDIYFCQQQLGSAKKIGTIYDKQDLIDTISNGDHYNGKLNSDCLSCQYQYVCSGGCPMSRVNEKSESCNFYHKIIPEVYRLIGLERLKHINDLRLK